MGDEIKLTAGSDIVRNALIAIVTIMVGVIGWFGAQFANTLIENDKEARKERSEIKTTVATIVAKQDAGRVEWDDKAAIAFKDIARALEENAAQDIQINTLTIGQSSLQRRVEALERHHNGT